MDAIVNYAVSCKYYSLLCLGYIYKLVCISSLFFRVRASICSLISPVSKQLIIITIMPANRVKFSGEKFSGQDKVARAFIVTQKCSLSYFFDNSAIWGDQTKCFAAETGISQDRYSVLNLLFKDRLCSIWEELPFFCCLQARSHAFKPTFYSTCQSSYQLF